MAAIGSDEHSNQFVAHSQDRPRASPVERSFAIKEVGVLADTLVRSSVGLGGIAPYT